MAREPTREPARELAREPTHEPAREPARELAREPTHELALTGIVFVKMRAGVGRPPPRRAPSDQRWHIMSEYAPLDLPAKGKLARNIAYFARALRRAGLPIGTGRVIDAVRAVEAAGFTERPDFYFTLQACFVSRPEHRVVFDQVFRLFWRDPRYLEHMMALMLPTVRGVQ
ncbi:MAG: hypothetical protein U1D06_03785, partial [Paracoccaceae bacterium]|nr:hypothetical protein [Paracoccaceae bacterium]